MSLAQEGHRLNLFDLGTLLKRTMERDTILWDFLTSVLAHLPIDALSSPEVRKIHTRKVVGDKSATGSLRGYRMIPVL